MEDRPAALTTAHALQVSRHTPLTPLLPILDFAVLLCLSLLPRSPAWPLPSYKYVIMHAGVPQAPLLLRNLSWQTKVHWISHSGLKDLLLRV